MSTDDAYTKARDEAAGIYECETQHPERQFNENNFKHRDFQAGFDKGYAYAKQIADESHPNNFSGYVKDQERIRELEEKLKEVEDMRDA